MAKKKQEQIKKSHREEKENRFFLINSSIINARKEMARNFRTEIDF